MSDLDTTFVTADSHFQHKSILAHDSRPFSNIDEHDETIIEKWNATVPTNGTVYHLGDFAWKTPATIRARLNGRIILIEGNHDRHFKRKEMEKIFDSVHDYLLLKIHRRRLTLCHYSMRTWYAMWKGGLHLHGHSHGQLPPLPGCLDVGIHLHDYKPLSIQQVFDKIGTFQGANHHTDNR